MGMRVYFSGGVVFPVLLVAAGILLLLNTLGLVEWSVWHWIGRLWPVFLIVGGIVLLAEHVKGE